MYVCIVFTICFHLSRFYFIIFFFNVFFNVIFIIVCFVLFFFLLHSFSRLQTLFRSCLIFEIYFKKLYFQCLRILSKSLNAIQKLNRLSRNATNNCGSKFVSFSATTTKYVSYYHNNNNIALIKPLSNV